MAQAARPHNRYRQIRAYGGTHIKDYVGAVFTRGGPVDGFREDPDQLNRVFAAKVQQLALSRGPGHFDDAIFRTLVDMNCSAQHFRDVLGRADKGGNCG